MAQWEGYVDWRNRPATKARHGGMVAASFVLGKQIRLPPSPARFDLAVVSVRSRFFQCHLDQERSTKQGTWWGKELDRANSRNRILETLHRSPSFLLLFLPRSSLFLSPESHRTATPSLS